MPPVVVTIDCIRDTETTIEEIRTAVQRFPGQRPLHLCLRRANGREVVLVAGTAYRVSDEVYQAPELQAWLQQG